MLNAIRTGRWTRWVGRRTMVNEVQSFSLPGAAMITVGNRRVLTKPVDKRAAGRPRIAAVADDPHGRLRVDPAPPPAPGPGELVVRRRPLALSGVHLALVAGTAGPGRLPSGGTALWGA